MNTSRAQILGEYAHRTIQWVLTANLHDPVDIDKVVNRLVTAQDELWLRRRPAKQTLGSCARVYLWDYDLRATHEVVATEWPTGECRIDIVWRSRSDGSWVFDEIKTGAAPQSLGEGHGQTDTYAAEGHRLYGAQFAGVRCLPLRKRGAGMLKTGPGVVVPLPAHLVGGGS